MLSRHLAGAIGNEGSGISSSPTSAGNSVFANVVRAPEDPILGVIFLYTCKQSCTCFILVFSSVIDTFVRN